MLLAVVVRGVADGGLRSFVGMFLMATHLTSVMSGVPFSTTYVTSSAPWPLPSGGQRATACAPSTRLRSSSYFRSISVFRSGLNPARCEVTKSSGCSHAAKWVPLSTLL